MADLSHDYVRAADATWPDFKCRCGNNIWSVWHDTLDRKPPRI